MAKLSKVVSNAKKKKLINRYAKKRQELKAKMINMNLSDEERYEAQEQLQKLPRNSSPIRYRNRCVETGRSRGYLGTFQLSRIRFRELAHRGILPGVTKSSW